MAYAVKYRYTFDSEQGTPFRIDILKDGYSGSVLSRCLGGSPVLRRDKSDNICGTSLEIPAECAVDGEYEEFKTSVPFTFKVNLYGGNNYGTLIWTGYVTPELMSAPDIAPPYDVQVSCTDGLGELKYTKFPARGGATLRNHLTYLLGLTGLSLSVTQVNDLYHGSYSAAQFLDKTGVNLDFMAGETCYDVLQAILVSLHSFITQYGGSWLIFKETGALINTAAPAITNVNVDGSAGGHVPVIGIDTFGSMATHQNGFWPIGYMSHSNEPPRKRMVLTADNHYPANILSDAAWTLIAGASDEGYYWALPAEGDGIKQSHNFGQEISQKLLLSIKVRNVGTGTDAGKLSVKVKAVGRSYAGSATYYLANGTYGRRNAKTDFSWVVAEQDSVIDVQAPSPEDTDDDYVEIGVVIPAYKSSARDYFYISSLEITVSNSDGTYAEYIYGVSLSKYAQFQGMRKEINLNNGARGDGPNLDLSFAAIAGLNDYIGVEQMMYGVLFDPTFFEPIPELCSSTFSTGLDYLSLMARDYALSIAGARTRLRGRLNVPVGRDLIPVAFRDDTDSTYYFIETFSWNLWDDEIDVEMLSKPATSITVADESLDQSALENATGHAQAESSNGGGGGTGTVTSVALSMPTYFDISGSPVTASGTLTATLKTTYKIPTVTEWNAVDGAKHTHSNKSILDGISQSDVSDWDDAASQAHSHSNKSVLDYISSGDVLNWDTAYQQAHTHSNKSQLDSITANDINGWDDAASKAHSHSNKSVLDYISSGDVSNWDTAYQYSHSHSNKSVLDGITQAKVNSWDAAASLDVDVSIGGTDAAPTVAVELSNGNDDSVALPVASSTKAGIVSTGAQTFSGYKTFDRIYLGNSGSSNAYIEWDSNAGGFKIVGDVYATGGVSAGA
jgi:hypothetical protein